MTTSINIKGSLSELTTIGDMAFDPSALTISTLTADGIKTMTGISASAIGPVLPPSVVEDTRLTIAEKPLAIQVSVSDFERLSHNNADHMMRLINDASEKLRRTIQSDTRCGGCAHMSIKVDKLEDMMRAETRHILTTTCGLRKPGMVGVVCPDGRATSVRQNPTLEIASYQPEVTPKADPDKPSTTFDEAW
jgi:hypothetical protein